MLTVDNEVVRMASNFRSLAITGRPPLARNEPVLGAFHKTAPRGQLSDVTGGTLQLLS